MMLAWFHTLDPIIWKISGDIAVRWYGVSYILGFIVAYMVMRRLARRGFTPLTPQFLFDALTWLVLGLIVGGRMGYVLIYKRELLWTFTDHAPFWGVLMLNNGGMASHGGMIGVIIACILLSRKMRGAPEQPSILNMFDVCALACTPGLGFGRIANFINGELLGKIVAPPGEKGPWWSVQYPQELIDGQAPQLTAEQGDALVKICAQYAPGLSIDRACERLINMLHTSGITRDELVAKLSPLISHRHPSQLYQCFAESIVLGGILWLIWRRPRKPGVIAAWFMIVYGIGRIITEFWRLPDADLAVQRMIGFSRGQWLSVLMILVGSVLLTVCSRRNVAKIGGGGTTVANS
jgi:phosphatidylglycerol:prolipoprotein diacylglycerol transferase